MSLEIALERIRSAKENVFPILDLSHLGLKVIPKEIVELAELTHLYLQGNAIEEVTVLEPLIKLKLLSLGNNQLIEVPTFLLKLDIPILWDEDYTIYPSINIVVFTELLAGAIVSTLSLYEALSSQDLDLSRALAHSLNLIRALDQARALDRVRAISLDLPSIRNQATFLARGLERALSRDLERDTSRERELALFLAREQGRALSQGLGLFAELDLIAIRDISLDLSKALARLQGSLQDRDLSLAVGLALSLKDGRKWVHHYGVYLYKNPVITPPPEIIKQGKDAISTFFRDFLDKESLNEVKVILVGEGASGKTSLVKRLLNGSFDKKEPQTHGIKISKQSFQYQEQNFTVNFWDFGGQEIMHATHQFFLTRRCLYVLVLDSRKDEKAEYWLNYIQSFGGDAPVLVVLNKTDENPSFDVNRKFLSKKYENIQSYYKVSCRTDEGIVDLRQALMHHLWNLELRNTALPKGWFKVKKHLESMQKDYINYATYQSICGKNHVHNAVSQRVLLELLNDLGVVLNYEQLRWYDTQVLNPLWLTNAVYRIINSPILAKSNGKFNINDLDAIINDPRYQKENPEHWTNIFRFWKPEEKLLQFPEEKFLFIVAMMKKFELLFQIDEFHYLIPALLSDHENSYKFDTADPTLVFVIEYLDFLPTSIVPRLMVKLHKYIYKDQVWKTGMVLQETLLFHSIANIILDRDSKKIHIEIQGKRNRDFLTVIRETLKEINATYQDLAVTEWIPLPELFQEELLLVDYEELQGYEEAGQQQYFSGKLRKAFPVDGLLNGIEKPEQRKPSKPCHIFISYSRQDHDYKEKLIENLIPLVRLNKATLWEDTYIDAGEDWRAEIFENLAKADIVLCLISSSFIASDFCYTQEMTQALSAHREGNKTVIPIRIKEVNWGQLEIATLKSLPADKWLSELTDNRSWTEISKGIEKAIEKIKSK